MNHLPADKQAMIFRCIAEGNSLRATSRLVGVSFNAVLRNFVRLGRACQDFQDKALSGLTCQRLQLDEVHSFVGVKEREASPDQLQAGFGDTWTWTCLDADTKLIVGWYVGERDQAAAFDFLRLLRARVVNQPQISTDGHSAYPAAMQHVFGQDAPYGRVVKVYGYVPSPIRTRDQIYKCIGANKIIASGTPDPAHVSTSFSERSNLTIRMLNRRFTRLTNAFSKKVENHRLSLAITFMHYNFCRIHQTLRVTPAMEAGLTDHVWEVEEVVGLLRVAEAMAA